MPKTQTANEPSHLRAPKQQRSKASYDRVIAAATELLRENGVAGLTLAAVSRQSKVSIGSIYCRIDGKDALIREVQANVLQQMEKEFALLVSRVRRRQLPLAELVPAMVSELAHYLRRHAGLLAAFMQQGDKDPVVEDVGRRLFAQNVTDFKLVLLDREAEFGHPEPDHAATTCFTVSYSALARFLGLNSGAPGHGGKGEGDWRRLVDDLGLMCLGFVLLDVRENATESAKRARNRKAPARTPA